ncbi:MAG TPA: PEGA domain-containing protein, partial [Terriglobia bacterium]|nr:PEGA domain-containing protein [Terriglobia bacterium]
MDQTSRTIIRLTLLLLLACVPVLAQRRGGGGAAHAFHYSQAAPIYGREGSYGGYGYYPSSSSPPSVSPIYGPYPSENPCQAGCNPNAGYEWDSVGALILDTNPPQARVTLDSIYAGTTDKLGPFQLPVGQHTLHIEAAGFEPSDIIVKFDQPGVQSLNVELKRLTASAKPAP